MSVSPGSTITQADMASLASLANSKTSLQTLVGTHYPYSFPDWTPPGVGTNPSWLTELNDLRADISAVVSPLIGTSFMPTWIFDSISGSAASAVKVAGWPLSGLSSTGPSVNNQYLKFWYEDNGSSQSVTASGAIQSGSSGKYSTTTISANDNYTVQDAAMTYVISQSAAPLSGGSPNYYTVPWPDEQQFDLIIGGTSNVTINADFFIPCNLAQGGSRTPPGSWVPDSGTPPVPTFDASSWFSGATNTVLAPSTWTLANGTWANRCYVVSSVSGTYAPGRYTLKVMVPTSNDTTTVSGGSVTSWTTTSKIGLGNGAGSNVPGTASLGVVNYSTFNYPTSSGTGSGTISSQTFGPGVQEPGIDRKANILMIDLASLYPPGGKPFSTIEVGAIETDIQGSGSNVGSGPNPGATAGCLYYAWQATPFPQPTFSGERYTQSTVTITATCSGFWTGMSPPISSIHPIPTSTMPWNVSVPSGYTTFSGNPVLNSGVTGGNSYNQSLTVEAQSEPPLWKASTPFAQGITIQDSNGNFQQCTHAGTTGASHPTWGTQTGALTTDNTAIWICTNIPAAVSISPAVHFPERVPIYPFYWTSETDQSLIDPTASLTDPTIWGYNAQWNCLNGATPTGWYVTNPSVNPSGAAGGHAFGFWIYGLSLNRVSQTIGGLPLPTASNINVTIGCMRNGTFTSFGTFQTGQNYQVLWPIFTSDSLVYQATERVDIQAMAIGVVTSSSSSVPAVSAGFPMAASYILDTIALLNLIT